MHEIVYFFFVANVVYNLCRLPCGNEEMGFSCKSDLYAIYIKTGKWVSEWVKVLSNVN